jgi:hypothetical protein
MFNVEFNSSLIFNDAFDSYVYMQLKPHFQLKVSADLEVPVQIVTVLSLSTICLLVIVSCVMFIVHCS